MKKVIFAMIVCAVMAAPSLAGLMTFDGMGQSSNVWIYGDRYTAGELLMTTTDLLGDADGTQFATFCLEMNETVADGTTYTAYLSDAAKAGGAGGAVNGQDPLDARTAWVYDQYTSGNLAGFSATDVQVVIWRLEEEFYGDLYGSAGALYDMALECGWTDTGDYRVANLYDANGGYHQDVIVEVSPVPVPGAALLGLLGLGAAGIRMRKHA